MRAAALEDFIALAKTGAEEDSEFNPRPFSKAVAESTQEDKFVVHDRLVAALEDAGYTVNFEMMKVLHKATVVKDDVLEAFGASDSHEDALRQALYNEVKYGGK